MKVIYYRIALLFCFALLNACTPMPTVENKHIEPDPGKRTFGTYIDDERLESIIKLNFERSGPGLDDARIEVKVFNGVALLTGEVQSQELKERAGKITREINKIRQVHNQLMVKANSTFMSKTNDNWIATKVRTKLLARRDIESERVKVIVENRVVYLMGLLTEEEAETVSEMAAKVSGVEKVVRVIEYIESRD